jgi:type IV pilus assembly protein PilM
MLKKLKDKFSKERYSVGLDIGTHSIKVVKLKFFKDKTELSSFDLEPVQLDLAEVLKKLKQSHNLESVNLNVCCGPATIIRCVNFPKMSSAELKQALKFEAQKHIPFSMAEVNLDGCILKDDLPENKMLVLIVAAKKELVNQRLRLLESSGLKANIIDVDSLSLVNTFNFNYSDANDLKNKTIALLNIGASISSLDILEGGVLLLSRDISCAGNNLTQKLIETLVMDFKAAEILKINFEAQQQDKVKPALESVVNNLVSEIRISFDYYESQSSSTVAKIFLSGGSSRMSGLKEMLNESLGIEVEYWDPFGKIDISNNIDSRRLKTLSSQFAVAVGLALRQ